MVAAVVVDTGADFAAGAPAPDPYTIAVTAAATGSMVIAGIGGDSDTGHNTVWGGSGWLKGADIGGGGMGTYGFRPANGDPPNGTVDWDSPNDRIGGVWASFLNVDDYDVAHIATGVGGNVRPPELTPKRRMGAYDLWVVVTGCRYGAGFTITPPDDFSTLQSRDNLSRCGGIWSAPGGGRLVYDPGDFTSDSQTCQATAIFALYGTPPSGGGAGFGRIG